MHRNLVTMHPRSLRQYGHLLLIRRSAVCTARPRSSGCLTLWETMDSSAPYKRRSPWITRCASKQQPTQTGYAGYSLCPVAFLEVPGTLDNAANYQTVSSDCRGDRSSQATDRVGAYQMPEHLQTLGEGTGWYVREEVLGGISVRSGQLHYCKKVRKLGSMWDLRVGKLSGGQSIYSACR